MSVFITCDGTVSVGNEGEPICSGTWATVESETLIQGNQAYTAAEWEYVWDSVIWIFVAAASYIVLMRLIKSMSSEVTTHES
jgi:hypothetical protein